jgi:uncharacterized protein YecE (DUF72 family)
MKVANRQIYLGTAAWKYRDWFGSFYPDSLKKEESLSYYSQFFDSVEVLESFFGLPPPEKMLQWYSQTPPHFVFSMKLPRLLSHELRFKNAQKAFHQFCEAFALLREKGAVVFIQLPPNFQQKNITDLIFFLEKEYHHPFKVAVEFTNVSWKKTEIPAFFKEKNISIVQNDLEPLSDPRANFLYLRWKGKQVYQHFAVEQRNPLEDLKIWKLRFNQLSGRIQQIFGYFSNHYSGYAPNNAILFLDLLRNPM